MRIGIVTLPLHTNYGGILQAYALQTVLERLGHNVEHLQPEVVFTEPHPSWKMPLVYCKRALRKYIGGEIKIPIFTHPNKWVRKHTDVFIATYIHARYLKPNDWNEEIANEYDAIIFGSDQIWREIYAYPIDRYFGSFLGDTKINRISYAASFGAENNEYSREQQVLFSSLLKKFDAVSVREQSAVSICEERFGTSALNVLDPTLLLSMNDYKTIFENTCTPKSKGTLALYVLDENPRIETFINKQSKLKGLIPFRTNSKVENHNAKLSERQQPPLENWLSAFHDAEFVITDSFHACVFSILFHKPFICLGNKSRGMSRFESLLSMFGLEDRLVDINDLDGYVEKKIDWKQVDRILELKREESLKFLAQALQSC